MLFRHSNSLLTDAPLSIHRIPDLLSIPQNAPSKTALPKPEAGVRHQSNGLQYQAKRSSTEPFAERFARGITRKPQSARHKPATA
ncbi:MAG: hypothetical protein LBG87_09910 [Spirochaetaceae bacterium]|nr:hypothetical protein [Spirochaetaceae bacterium]